MLKHKNINKICWAAIALVVILAMLFATATSLGWIAQDNSMGYENRLFDTSRVHTIDIVMDDWDGFIETATMEEYSSCTIIVDGEKYSNVGIRAKGNSSLSQVSSYGNGRYSFKVEFDQYSSGNSYYGLDKISLNNVISDNTYMKDHLTYQMMNSVGIASPFSSYVYITVNGEDWGLYLAVEAVEDGFLQRNYGKDYGELYKPDSMNMGGGRGNGRDFNMDDFMNEAGRERDTGSTDDEVTPSEGFDSSGGRMALPEGFDSSEGGMTPPEGFDPSSMFGDGENGAGGFGGGFGNMGGMGSSDVSLQYIDDDPDSYPNIFGNAKTDIIDADQTRLIDALKKLNEGTEIENVVDVEAVIKYLVVHDFVQNGDSYTGSMVHNYYLYEENGVLSMIPWDYNLAFGSFSMGRGMGGSMGESGTTSVVNAPIDSPVTSDTLESRPMVAWIFESEEYTALYHQYYAEFIAENFDSGYFDQMMDETIALISSYVEKDPTAFCTYDEFLVGVETLREFCLLRAESISGQLDGTIPSTQEGQSTDSTTLVDASHIVTSDMGNFSNGGGGFGGRGNMPNMGERLSDGTVPVSDGEEQSNTSEDNSGGVPPASSDNTQGQPNRGDRFGEGGMPEGFGSSNMAGGSSTSNGGTSIITWVLLGGSILLLLVGLLIAKRYKR